MPKITESEKNALHGRQQHHTWWTFTPSRSEGAGGRSEETLRAPRFNTNSRADASGFKGKTDDGKLIGPFNPFLYSTGITHGFLQWMQAESKLTSLDKRVHEVVILSTGPVWQSPYELYAHSAVGANRAFPRPRFELVSGKSSEDLSPEEQVAHRFAGQLATEHHVDADLYREAESMFGRTGLVDMVYLIGMYLLTSALLNAFKIPAPE